MEKNTFDKIRIYKICFWALVVITVVWNFPFLSKGIDVDDTAYSLSQYRYVFDKEYSLSGGSTLITNIIGGILFKLGGDYRVIMLNAANLFAALMAGFLLYRTLKRREHDILLVLAVLIGSFFHCSWTRILNYNSVSMFFQSWAIALLLGSLKDEKKLMAFIAGIILGFNIFVRLPNGLQACLGAVYIWYFGILKKDCKKTFQFIGSYAAGGILGTLAGVVIELRMLGWEKFIGMFISTANTATQSDSRHGLGNMWLLFQTGVKNGLKVWALWILVLLVLYGAGRLLMMRKEQWLIRAASVSVLGVSALLAFYLSRKYDILQIPVMSEFGGIMGTGFMLAAVVSLFYFAKKNEFLSSLALILFLSEFILIFGTDNGWYYQVVFMVFPVMAVCVLLTGSESREIKLLGEIVLAFILVFSGSRGMKFASQYSYREDSIDQLNCSVDLAGYKGMKTSKTRAEILNELNEQLKLYAVEGKEILALGNASICYEVAEAAPYVDSAWPDLEGVSMSRFCGQIESKTAQGNYPVIVFVNLGYNQPYDMEKYEYVQEMLDKYQYTLQYQNQSVEVYTIQ